MDTNPIKNEGTMNNNINELTSKVALAYDSCSLKSVNAFNPYQFEKMIDVLSVEYKEKGLSAEDFKFIVNDAIRCIGGLYVYKI